MANVRCDYKAACCGSQAGLDVRAIAGHDYEQAVIPEDRLPLLSRYDARAAHYEVVSTIEPP